MEAQRERARAASQFKSGAKLDYAGRPTAFRGYDTLSLEGRVTALYKGRIVGALARGGRAGGGRPFGNAVLRRIRRPGGRPWRAVGGRRLPDAISPSRTRRRSQPEVFGHFGAVVTGELKVGDTVAANVDHAARARTMRNHSATHLMHKALREVLGPHVQQRGSLVDPDKTRFDFAHGSPLTDDDIRRIEAIVNAEILRNVATEARVMPIEAAQKTGAMMLFGEKYGDEVRVLDIGNSRELCGGTHVGRTGDSRFFQDRGGGWRRGRHPARRGGDRRQCARVGAGAGGDDGRRRRPR